jgi:replicative DNA helicase
MNIPQDHDAERALLAAMLLTSDAITDAERIVDASDFHRPAHGDVFEAIRLLHADGIRADTTTVLDALKGRVDADVVLAAAAFRASSSSAGRYAKIVAEHAVRRRLIAAGQELAEAAATGEPDDVLEAHITRLEHIELPSVQASGLMLLDDVLDRPKESRSPWVVPGLLARDWRCVIVAPEGAGKTLILQQIAMCASQGVHPFSLKTGFRPVKTLLIDAENPEERIKAGCAPIRDVVTRLAGWTPRTQLWHQPGGLDLRSRRDVAALEDILYRVQPELVCAGPSYKLAERGPREGWDEPARALQQVLDKLRIRFGFALLLEDHAPQASGNVRELRPFGSSLWLRWPELGLKLIPGDAGALKVEHWRGARMEHGWPDELQRGGTHSLPWLGYWRNGMGDF